MAQKILIVGASQAGIQLATSLRERSADDEIVLIGDEPFAPYHRPPLSKLLHSRSAVPSELLLRLPAFFSTQRITLHTDDPVVSVDHDRRQARTRSGRLFEYSKLALTVGAGARRLAVPGAGPDGIMYLRTYADALAIGRKMAGAARIVVIGAGLIGMEFAGLAARQGKSVTVVEIGSAILQRVAGAAISQFVQKAHAANGVGFRFGRTVHEICGMENGPRRVVLDDGTELIADIIVAGIGSQPRTELAEAMGLACLGGILVDEGGRTSIDGIVAAGDCAAQRLSHHAGEATRFESVSNAINQARIAAATLHGERLQRTSAHWFWSDQGECKLQFAGSFREADKHTIEADADGRRLVVRHYKDGQLVALECVNAPGEFLAARRNLDRSIVSRAVDQALSAAG